MADSSEFKGGQIVDARMVGASVTEVPYQKWWLPSKETINVFREAQIWPNPVVILERPSHTQLKCLRGLQDRGSKNT